MHVLENNKITRPTASCFHQSSRVWKPRWNTRTLFWNITSTPTYLHGGAYLSLWRPNRGWAFDFVNCQHSREFDQLFYFILFYFILFLFKKNSDARGFARGGGKGTFGFDRHINQDYRRLRQSHHVIKKEICLFIFYFLQKTQLLVVIGSVAPILVLGHQTYVLLP